jgi:hypothetical protein
LTTFRTWAIAAASLSAPVSPASFDELGLDSAGKAALVAAGASPQVQADLGNQGPVTVLLRVRQGHSELVVVGSDGRIRFTESFKKRPPRGLRFERATAEVSLLFELGPALETSTRTLRVKGSSYAIGATIRAAQ